MYTRFLREMLVDGIWKIDFIFYKGVLFNLDSWQFCEVNNKRKALVIIGTLTEEKLEEEQNQA